LLKILGDNPFFGVNHAGKGRELYINQNLSVASEVITEARDQNFDIFMVSPHEELPELSEFFENGQIPLPLCVVWPYPHKLNQELVKLGYRKFIMQNVSLKNSGEILHNIFSILLSRTKNLKASGIIKNMLESEINTSFEKQNIKYFALHNIIYDLLLAAGNKSLLVEFTNAVVSLGFQPVLLTQNISKAIKDEFYVEGAVLCGSFNLRSFMMDESYEETGKKIDKFRMAGGTFWAMQILASGTLAMDELITNNFFERLDGSVYATTKKERIANFASVTNLDG
jgi:hypothetical protein